MDVKEITTVDQIVEQLLARRAILEANPRSMEVLEGALNKATKIARLEWRRNEELKKKYRIGYQE